MLRPHYPTPLTGLLLVFAAGMLTYLGVAMQIDPNHPSELPDVGARGIAFTFAFGLVATLAARRVPAPQPERLGLVGFDKSFAAVLLALLPFVIVMSEADNWISLWFPPADPEALREALEEMRAKDTTLSILQRAIFVVGLQPVVVEWLMRGVVLQGAIAYMGRVPGLLFTSVVGIGTLQMTGGGSIASLMILSVAGGVLLGSVRIATGSILAPILLHMGWNAIGVTAGAFREQIPIPGFNELDGFTPPLLLLVSVASVVLGLTGVARGMSEQPVVLEIEEEPDPEEDEGGFF